MTSPKPTWRFPRAFWTANGVELCERAAYYGTFIALRTYLLRVVHLTTCRRASWPVSSARCSTSSPSSPVRRRTAWDSAKRSLLAFALLAVGYGALGVFSDSGPGARRACC